MLFGGKMYCGENHDLFSSLILWGNLMGCKNNDQNISFVSFSYSCNQNGDCCKCVSHHHENGGIPQCFSGQKSDIPEAKRKEEERLEQIRLEAEKKEVQFLQQKKLEAERIEKELFEQWKIEAKLKEKAEEEALKNEKIAFISNPICIEIFFKCCNLYGKLYISVHNDYYVGKCPKCKSNVIVPVGGEGPRFGLSQQKQCGCI